MRTRSPSRAPPENGEDGSTARTPTLLSCLRYAVTSAEVDVDLPTPGEPVRPTTYALPVSGASVAMTSLSCGDAPSTREISRATARGRPSLAWATRVETSCITAPFRWATYEDSGLWYPHDERVTLTAATAQRGRADPAAAPLELQGEVQDEPGAGHADGVAEGDGAAVHVHLFGGYAEVLHRLDRDGRERLVDLDQVEVGNLQALLLEGVQDRVGRLGLQGVVGTRHIAVGADLGDPVEAELLGLGLAHDDHGRRPVRDLRGGSGGDGAVLGERGA